MKCEHCEIVSRKNSQELLYEDNDVVVAIKDNAITPGQISVFPKEHFTILEMVPNHLVAKCMDVANKVSIASFESLGSAGTNLFVQNGLSAGQSIPHFGIEIVPRQENDGLSLSWEGKQLAEDELDMLFGQLKNSKEFVEKGLKQKVEPVKKEVVVQDDTEIEVQEEPENYLIKSIRRIP